MSNKFIMSRPRSQEGATAVEYGLIAGLIAVVIVAALVVLGPDLAKVFTTVDGKLQSATTG